MARLEQQGNQEEAKLARPEQAAAQRSAGLAWAAGAGGARSAEGVPLAASSGAGRSLVRCAPGPGRSCATAAASATSVGLSRAGKRLERPHVRAGGESRWGGRAAKLQKRGDLRPPLLLQKLENEPKTGTRIPDRRLSGTFFPSCRDSAGGVLNTRIPQNREGENFGLEEALLIRSHPCSTLISVCSFWLIDASPRGGE